jgi:hypothetical protein
LGRNSSRTFRKSAQFVIARDAGMCGICGHGGAVTADHIISVKDWPPGVPGVDYPDNLQAAHGTRRPHGVDNPCFVCDPRRGRLCNQSKGAGHAPKGEQHSRAW